jgi:hypothetical protein
MRMLPFTSLALSAVLVLTGCVSPQPLVMPTPAPTSTPLFASDEEALAAATAAYTEYLRVSDAITADGGTNPERIKPLVTAEQYAVELTGFNDLSSRGWRTKGNSSFKNATLQTNDFAGSVSIYVCSVTDAIRVVDAAGADVTPVNTQGFRTLQVSFAAGANFSLILDRTELWDSESSC